MLSGIFSPNLYFLATVSCEKHYAMIKQRGTLFLNQIEAILERQLGTEDFHVQELADAIPLSRIQLFRKLKQLTGFSPTTYIRHFRLRRGKKLLIDSSIPIKEIAYKTGFKDPAHFTNAFKKLYGIAPKETRKMEIHFQEKHSTYK